MLTVKGVYDRGVVKLDQDVKIKKAVNVLITFLDDSEIQHEIPPKRNDFSFRKSKELLKNYKGSLSQAVLEERRSHV